MHSVLPSRTMSNLCESARCDFITGTEFSEGEVEDGFSHVRFSWSPWYRLGMGSSWMGEKVYEPDL